MAEIFTTKGMIDEALLVKKEGGYESDTEIQTFQEYYFEGELVKRDVQLHLKQGLQFIPEQASL